LELGPFRTELVFDPIDSHADGFSQAAQQFQLTLAVDSGAFSMTDTPRNGKTNADSPPISAERQGKNRDISFDATKKTGRQPRISRMARIRTRNGVDWEWKCSVADRFIRAIREIRGRLVAFVVSR
jgi:hypothetical protein